MLFGKTLEEHWKISQGSVIALLNSKIMDSSEKVFFSKYSLPTAKIGAKNENK